MRWTSGILPTLFALTACSVAPAAQPAPFVVQPGHIDLARGPDGNTVILDAPDGLIVVDTGRHPEHVERIASYARSVGKPIAAIVNTHWHLDHTTGNRDVKRTWPEARVIATGAGRAARTGFLASSIARTREMAEDPSLPAAERKAAVRRLAAVTDNASFLPAKPIAHDQKVEVAGRTLELHVAPAAATEADLWLVAPDERLAIVGDLVVAQAPFFDTGCEEGWKAALDAIGAAEWDTLIPGHGDPMTRADFWRWRVAFDGFLECGGSDVPAQACAERWASDAQGFYSEAEAESVRQLIAYYVEQVLRAPAGKRMAYCTLSR